MNQPSEQNHAEESPKPIPSEEMPTDPSAPERAVARAGSSTDPSAVEESTAGLDGNQAVTEFAQPDPIGDAERHGPPVFLSPSDEGAATVSVPYGTTGAGQPEDDAAIPIGIVSPVSESVTSPSMQPILPVQDWTSGGESIIRTEPPPKIPTSAAPDDIPVAEALPFAEEVSEPAIPQATNSLEGGTPPSSIPSTFSSAGAQGSSSIPLAQPASSDTFSSDIHANPPPPGPAAESSNLFGPFAVPPGSESSNIHTARPVPPLGEESALSFLAQLHKMPAGSSGTSEPSLAEDVSSGTARPPEDAPDYGAAPKPSVGASHILADLAGSGIHSSAVRLENPGMGRTLRPGSSTESGFDIDMELGPIPKELEEAEQAARSDILESPLQRRPASEATMPEVYIDDPQAHILAAVPPPPRDPSSIFDADLDLPPGAELLKDAPVQPPTQRSGDSGIIEWSVDEVPVATPGSDMPEEQGGTPVTGSRSAVIKPTSSAVMPPTPATSASPTAEPPAVMGAIPSSLAVVRPQETGINPRTDMQSVSARRTAGAWLGGALLGAALPLGGGAALYFSGLLGPTAPLEQRSRQAEQQAAALQSQLQQTQQQLSQLQEQLEQSHQELLQAQQTARLEREDRNRLQGQLAQSLQEIQSLRTLLDRLERDMQAATAVRKQLENDRQQLQKTLDQTQGDLKQALAQRDELQKQLSQAGDQRKKLEADLMQVNQRINNLQKDLQDLQLKRQDLEKKAQDTQQQLQALAKELQAARLLGDTYDAAALMEAQRRAVALLTSKPDLQQIRQLEEDKRQLTATVRRLEHKLQEQSEAFAKERRLLREQADSQLKQLQEQLQAEARKRESQLQSEVQRLQRQETALRQKLAQAPSDSEVLRVWLNLLAEARRPADAPAAQETARKVLQRVDPASEEAAQAHLVLALAALLTGQSDQASQHLSQVRQSPAYEAARRDQRPWVAMAEQVQLALHDPLASLRRPPQEQPRQPQLALPYLDEAILAYRNGRFDQAIRAAQQAVLYDATDPVAWYY
ncbi:MAG: hypothetical protein NZ703_01455, partial [Gemmataceae bacterium]|nr:hypothetical protein [Gemmataceae bacterium]